MPAGGFTRPRDKCERAGDFHELFRVPGGVFLVPGEPHADRKIHSLHFPKAKRPVGQIYRPFRHETDPDLGGNERNQGERIVATVGDLIEKAVFSELLEKVLFRVR